MKIAVDPWTPRDTRAVAALAGLAFALRALVALMSDVIGADAPAFLHGAREILGGDWATSLGNGIHPGYPLAVAVAGTPLGDLECAAYAVSVVFGSLAVVPFYGLVRDMAGRRAAVLAALFLATMPYFVLEHADIMTEGLFHCLFVTSVALAWFGATRTSLPLTTLAGFAGGLAYLTRPEGIYAPVALAGVAAFAFVETWRARRPRPAVLGHAALALAVSVAVASPLLLYYKHATGRWNITLRGSAQSAAGEPPPVVVAPGVAPAPPATDWGRGLRMYAYRMYRTSFTFVLPLALAGLFFLRGRFRGIGALLSGCVTLGYSFAPISAAAHGYPLSDRYVLVPVLFLLPFSAVGALGLTELAARRWGVRRPAVVASVLLGVLVAYFGLRSVHPRREPDRAVRQVGLWLRDRAGPGATVYSNARKVGWYWGRRVRLLPTEWDGELSDGQFLCINETRLARDEPELPRRIEARFRRVARFPAEPQEGQDTFSVFTR